VFASNNLLPYSIHVDLMTIFVVASEVFKRLKYEDSIFKVRSPQDFFLLI